MAKIIPIHIETIWILQIDSTHRWNPGLVKARSKMWREFWIKHSQIQFLCSAILTIVVTNRAGSGPLQRDGAGPACWAREGQPSKAGKVLHSPWTEPLVPRPEVPIIQLELAGAHSLWKRKSGRESEWHVRTHTKGIVLQKSEIYLCMLPVSLVCHSLMSWLTNPPHHHIAYG